MYSLEFTVVFVGALKMQDVKMTDQVARRENAGYENVVRENAGHENACLLYTSPSPRDGLLSRMPSSA